MSKYWYGGASTIMACMQYKTQGLDLPNNVSTLSNNANGVSTGWASGMLSPHASLPANLSKLANNSYVYSREWMVCGGRQMFSGLHNLTFNESLTLTVPQPGIRSCWIGMGMLPMWLSSHKHSNECRIKARYFVKNKSGVVIWQTAPSLEAQAWFYWDRPEKIPGDGVRFSHSVNVNEDIGSIHIEWWAFTDDNKWRAAGWKSNPLSWTPSFSMGGLKSIPFSTYYTNWNNESDSGRYVIQYTNKTERYKL